MYTLIQYNPTIIFCCVNSFGAIYLSCSNIYCSIRKRVYQCSIRYMVQVIIHGSSCHFIFLPSSFPRGSASGVEYYFRMFRDQACWWRLIPNFYICNWVVFSSDVNLFILIILLILCVVFCMVWYQFVILSIGDHIVYMVSVVTLLQQFI